ncbi:MAG: hypothetical protein U0360_05105 [Dehalococcoidia bacterium]
MRQLVAIHLGVQPDDLPGALDASDALASRSPASPTSARDRLARRA